MASNHTKQKAEWKIINQKDSCNCICVKKIPDQYCWLGKDAIGSKETPTGINAPAA